MFISYAADAHGSVFLLHAKQKPHMSIIRLESLMCCGQQYAIKRLVAGGSTNSAQYCVFKWLAHALKLLRQGVV